MNFEQVVAIILIIIASIAIIISRFYAVKNHFYIGIISNAYDDVERSIHGENSIYDGVESGNSIYDGVESGNSIYDGVESGNSISLNENDYWDAWRVYKAVAFSDNAVEARYNAFNSLSIAIYSTFIAIFGIIMMQDKIVNIVAICAIILIGIYFYIISLTI